MIAIALYIVLGTIIMVWIGKAIYKASPDSDPPPPLNTGPLEPEDE